MERLERCKTQETYQRPENEYYNQEKLYVIFGRDILGKKPTQDGINSQELCLRFHREGDLCMYCRSYHTTLTGQGKYYLYSFIKQFTKGKNHRFDWM